MLQAIGRVTVPAAGTPVRATSTQADPPARFACHGMSFQALSTNTGKIYIGDRNLDKATLTGVHAVLAPPTTNSLPSFSASLTLAPNAVHLHEVYLDADVNGEGVVISVLIT